MRFSQGRLETFGYIKPNTKLMQVVKSAGIEEKTPVVFLGAQMTDWIKIFK